MKTNMSITISGKNGIFNTEHQITLFHDHVTKLEVEETLAAIKKEVQKMVKHRGVMVDLSKSDDSYHSTPILRLISRWSDSVEYRPYTGYDFGNVTEMQVKNNAERIKYIMSAIRNTIYLTMEAMPETIGRYAQQLRDEKENNTQMEVQN